MSDPIRKSTLKQFGKKLPIQLNEINLAENLIIESTIAILNNPTEFVVITKLNII